jgi:hypothetical protein
MLAAFALKILVFRTMICRIVENVVHLQKMAVRIYRGGAKVR